MSKSNKEKKDKLHKVKSAKDRRKEKKTFLKNIKTNYQDQEFLDSLENKEHAVSNDCLTIELSDQCTSYH